MRFKSQQHKSTFKKAIRKKDKTDNKLMAAMYLLTADLPLWNRVKGSIRENSIDFDEIRLNTVTENGYTIYSASKDMYFIIPFLKTHGGIPRVDLAFVRFCCF